MQASFVIPASLNTQITHGHPMEALVPDPHWGDSKAT